MHEASSPPFVATGGHGQRLGRIDLPWASIHLDHYPASLELAPHAHGQASLCFVASGCLRELIEGEDIALGPGCLLGKSPGAVHRDRFQEPSRVINIDLQARTGENARGQGLDSGFRRGTVHSPVTAILGQRLRQELAEPDDLSPLIAEGLVLALWAEAARARGAAAHRRPPWIGVVDAALRDAFPRLPPLGELAAEVSMSPGYLSRRYREVTGMTIGDRVRRLRVEHAARLLARGVPQARVAAAAGFADQSHLSRVFRRMTGMTPRDYVRQSS